MGNPDLLLINEALARENDRARDERDERGAREREGATGV